VCVASNKTFWSGQRGQRWLGAERCIAKVFQK